MLGNAVKMVLDSVGITQQRAERWLGSCCCKERQERLNQLDAICRRFVRGRIEGARGYILLLLGEHDEDVERAAGDVVQTEARCTEDVTPGVPLPGQG